MKFRLLLAVGVFTPGLFAAPSSHAAKPADFSPAQIEEIWRTQWQSSDPAIRQPKVENLSERDVANRLAGTWTVLFGVVPDKITILLSTNRQVEVSGRKDGRAWKKTGEWRVMAGKLMLFLEQEDLPSFVFSIRGRNYIFDPWAKTEMSELKRES